MWSFVRESGDKREEWVSSDEGSRQHELVISCRQFRLRWTTSPSERSYLFPRGFALTFRVDHPYFDPSPLPTLLFKKTV